tara:strand:- start:822 stop:1016 length:195 start_codon:yes stop_codon:yes gene_type:complete
MNPIDSSKKWILNKLIPLIERKDNSREREKALIKDRENELSHSAPSRENQNNPYSDLLEDSEYS